MPDNFLTFLSYLAVMAGVTYLVRLLPILFIRKKIKSRFIRSFLYYVPYAVLTVMTIPAIFYSTGFMTSAIIGAAVAIALAFLVFMIVKPFKEATKLTVKKSEKK